MLTQQNIADPQLNPDAPKFIEACMVLPDSEQLLDNDLRKSEFRDIARAILAKDRGLRRNGYSVDTAGAIARELEKAYKLGRAHAGKPVERASRNERGQAGERVCWQLIPSRARDRMEQILGFRYVVVLACGVDWGPRPDKWALYGQGRDAAGAAVLHFVEFLAKSTLAPLIRMGLMAEVSVADRTYLVPTDLGTEVWRDAVATGQARDFSAESRRG